MQGLNHTAKPSEPLMRFIVNKSMSASFLRLTLDFA